MGKKKNVKKIKWSAQNTLKVDQKKAIPSKKTADFSIMKSIHSELFYLKTLLFIFPFFYGLFYDFTATLSGVVLSIYLLIIIIRRKEFRFSLDIKSLLLIFVFFSYLIVSIWAVDSGMAILGFIKFSPAIIFILILMQFSRDQITTCFSVIPWTGFVMVLVTATTYLIPDLAVYFYDAGRLGGFFQYANTFALFLLIGVIVIAQGNNSKPFEILKFGVLIIGILLTGSRISFVLMGCILIYYAYTSKNLRKSIGIISLCGVISVIVFILATGNVGSMGRITTIFSESSTFTGRFLYDTDAFRLLLQKPFGVGYMGFYYLQSQIQSGVYTIRFVHNEFLQMALDAGILSVLAFGFVCVKSFFSRAIGKYEKIILGTILIHAFFDFDFQYLIILFILLMTLDIGVSNFYRKKEVIIGTKIGLVILSLIYSYFSLGLYLGHLGYNQASLRMVPFNTEIKIDALKLAQSADEIEYWSDEILSGNSHIVLAYEGKAVVAAQRNDYEGMVSNMQKVVTYSRYDIKKYEEYLMVLEKTMNYYNEQGDQENLIKYANLALDIPKMLEQVLDETSPLAYMIEDQPALQLSQDEQTYLGELKKAIQLK